MKLTKTRIYGIMTILCFLTAILDILSGGTFSATIVGGFAVVFLCMYAANVEDTVKYDGVATYW